MTTSLTTRVSTAHASAGEMVRRAFSMAVWALVTIAALPLSPPASAQSSPESRFTPAANVAAAQAYSKANPPKAAVPRPKLLDAVRPSGQKLTEISGWMAGAVQSAGAVPAGSPLSVSQKNAFAQLTQRAAGEVDLKLRPTTGAVRQLKGVNLHRTQGADAITARSFLRDNRDLLKIKAPDDEFVLAGSETDQLGRRHLRFDQQYRGVPVWPARALVHFDPHGNVDLMNGAYVPTPVGETTPRIDRESAVAKARQLAPDGDSGELRNVQLILYPTDAGVAKLGWKVELAMALDSEWLVVVDAVDGGRLAAYNKVHFGAVPGRGVDLLNIDRPLQVYQDAPNLFYMVDTSKPMYRAGMPFPGNPDTRGGIAIRDLRNTPAGSPPAGNYTWYLVSSDAADSGWLPDAVSAAYGLSEVYDYYLERHQLNSWDGNGGTAVALVRYGTGYKNAFWNGSVMVFGDAQPYAGALDVVAHEMTHAVTEKTANLEYKDQSGALNEAFSDIFGEAVEARTNGRNDWLLAPSVFGRNLKDPGARTFYCAKYPDPQPFPARMSEFVPRDAAVLDCYVDRDNGGVHENSSIINHAFYLLVEGLPGAIGMSDAERIFYRALTVHLAPQSQFIDARLAAVASAEELFGVGSHQALLTRQAFDAVEIFDDSPTADPAPVPVVAGDDSTLFLFWDNGWQLGRREAAQGDGAGGVYMLDGKTLAYERAAVNGVGTVAAIVTSDHDFCVVRTDRTFANCLGRPNTFHSVALSPSARLAALVLLDSDGHPENQIWLLDLSTGSYEPLTLKAGASDAEGGVAIDYADFMTFDFHEKRLFYDAVSFTTAGDGSKLAVWSIHALELATGNTLSVLPPVPGANVANPALGHVRNHLLAFDAWDNASGNSTIYILNLATNKVKRVAETGGGFGYPSFMGDDSAVVFSRYDATVPTFRSLYRQDLDTDGMTPSGAAVGWLRDGDIATIYRRGSYVSAMPPGE